MMNSLKKMVICTLAMAPQTDMFANNQVILTTAAGVIAGTMVEEIEGNDGYMLLSDVTVINGNTRTNFEHMIVFYDQIIGMTLGTI